MHKLLTHLLTVFVLASLQEDVRAQNSIFASFSFEVQATTDPVTGACVIQSGIARTYAQKTPGWFGSCLNISSGVGCNMVACTDAVRVQGCSPTVYGPKIWRVHMGSAQLTGVTSFTTNFQPPPGCVDGKQFGYVGCLCTMMDRSSTAPSRAS